MDLTKVLTLILLAAPVVLCIALAISIRRSREKAREAERKTGRLNARIMFRGHMAKVDPGTTPSRIFRAGYRTALMEHAPHKLAEFDADWPHDMGSKP